MTEEKTKPAMIIKAASTLMFIIFSLSSGDQECSIRNNAFKDGETVTLKVYYNTLSMIYVPAGEATFTTLVEVYPIYLHFVKKDIVNTRYGKFRSLKFRPLLIDGTMFKGGEKMNVWISDDDNRLVLRVEAPIMVGNIKVDMMGFKNLRHPLKSLISPR